MSRRTNSQRKNNQAVEYYRVSAGIWITALIMMVIGITFCFGFIWLSLFDLYFIYYNPDDYLVVKNFYILLFLAIGFVMIAISFVLISYAFKRL